MASFKWLGDLCWLVTNYKRSGHTLYMWMSERTVYLAHYAEELAIQRERQKQLTWKTNIEVSSWSSEVEISIFHHCRDFIMVAVPCLALTVLLVKVTHLDGISAIAIPYGPPIKTFKVLNLSHQQWPDLWEETKVCGLLYGLIFHSL